MNKERLKIVPALRFPDFNKEWKPTTVDDNCILKGRIGYRGYTKEDLVEEGEGALVIGGKHIQNHILDLSDPTFLTWEKYYESPEIMVEINHIIFSQRGSLGDCALIDREIGKATINPSMVLIKDISCNIEFLYYTLIGNQIQKEVKRISTSAAVPMLSQKQIKGFSFFIPLPKEQQKIANCLSSLDNVIKAETDKLDHLKDHKKGLLQQLFPAKGETKPQFRFSEFKNDGDWVEKKLSDVSEIVTGTTPKTSDSKNYGGNKLFVSPADISETRYINRTRKKLSVIGFSKSRVIPVNSILFVCIGSTIGKIAQNKIECATNQQINSLIPFENYSNNFIYSILEFNSSLIASKAAQQAVPLINKSKFSAIKLYFPSNKDEQQKIADCFSFLDDLIETQNNKIEVLKKHKKGLMQQLFPNINELTI